MPVFSARQNSLLSSTRTATQEWVTDRRYLTADNAARLHSTQLSAVGSRDIRLTWTPQPYSTLLVVRSGLVLRLETDYTLVEDGKTVRLKTVLATGEWAAVYGTGT